MVKELEKKTTQGDFILEYMKKHGSISNIEAFDYGIARLAARIFDLRRKGYKILAEEVETETKNFGKTSYVRYSLEDENE